MNIIEVSRKARFTVDDDGKIKVWNSGRTITINKKNDTIADGIKRLVGVVRNETLADVIELCKNWDFNCQSLIKRIEELK